MKKYEIFENQRIRRLSFKGPPGEKRRIWLLEEKIRTKCMFRQSIISGDKS